MKSLSIKYRPTKFEDVCSQETTIKILTRQLEAGMISNTYLFYGPSGCGKTTVARILANAINENYGNPIEIDGASNNGVENVRNLIHSAFERAIDAKYKIYIIDECHALTNQAWQAFLKCIEEPPTYTIFIFCTTDIQKVPATIQNRCMKFNFTKISEENISTRLKQICNWEGCYNCDELCYTIARTCNGQMRDAISILEKCYLYSEDLELTPALLQIINNTSFESLFKLFNELLDDKEAELLSTLEYIHSSGIDTSTLVDQLLAFCMDLLKYCIFENIEQTKFLPSQVEEVIKLTRFDQNKEYYNYVLTNLLDLKFKLKGDTSPKVTLEVYLLKIARCQ